MPKGKRTYREADIQRGIYKWFCYNYPTLKTLLFAIPNGGKRSSFSAMLMKREGVTAGVADMFLAMPNAKYHGLFIEVKAEVGSLSEHQLHFRAQVLSQGYNHIVVRSSFEFEQEVKQYFSTK